MSWKRPPLLFLFALASWCSLAQPAPDSTRSFALGMGVGGVAFRGDLQEQYQGYSLEGSLYLVLNSEAFFSPSVLINVGSITAQNPNVEAVFLPNGDRITPPRFVRTSFQGIAFLPRFRLVSYGPLRVHAAAGVGLFRYVPRDAEGNEWLSAFDSRLSSESFSPSAIQIPLKLQVGWRWPTGLQWQAQASLLNPITDYVDNLSQLGTLPGNDNLLAFRLMILYDF